MTEYGGGWIMEIKSDVLLDKLVTKKIENQKKTKPKRIKILNERLRKLRLYTGLTQEEIAKKIQISKGAYVTYEKGTSLPPIPTLLKISKGLDYPIEWLLGVNEDDENRKKDMWRLRLES